MTIFHLTMKKIFYSGPKFWIWPHLKALPNCNNRTVQWLKEVVLLLGEKEGAKTRRQRLHTTEP